MADDNEIYTAAQVREALEGHADRDLEAFEHALIEDDRTRRLLTVLRQNYDPHDAANPDEAPATAKDLDLYQRVLRAAATEDLSAALSNGDIPRMKAHTGDTSERADISGMQAIEDLKSVVDGPAPVIYEYGHMGNGKTNFAILIAELWQDIHPNGEIGTNIRTLTEKDEWIPTFPALEDWMKEPEERVLEGDVTPKLFIFDEANSAQGTGEDQYNARTMLGPMVYKIRKYGGSLIVIGHDGKDVTPLVRELGTICHKEDTKKATFYHDIENREGVDEIMSVEGIPETDWRYNDREASDFRWDTPGDDDDSDDEITADDATWDAAVYSAVKAMENGASLRDAAKNVPYSKDWVRDRYEEYEDGEHDDLIQRVEELA